MGGIKHIYTQPLTSLETTPKEPLGAIRREDNKTYKYVKFIKGAGAVAIALGNVLVYNDAAGYDASQVTADMTGTSVGAGLALYAVTTAQMDAGAWGWILIRGAGLVSQDLTAIGTGVGMTLSISLGADGVFIASAAALTRDAVTLAVGAGTSRAIVNFAG